MTISVASPITTSRKNSGGPKPRASCANAGASSVISTTPSVPPMNEATACMTSAGPARPCWASG
jgi:hypothetical protein